MLSKKVKILLTALVATQPILVAACRTDGDFAIQ
jgi:hypothetical protein